MIMVGAEPEMGGFGGLRGDEEEGMVGRTVDLVIEAVAQPA
jgi:hypothetical protein